MHTSRFTPRPIEFLHMPTGKWALGVNLGPMTNWPILHEVIREDDELLIVVHEANICPIEGSAL